MNEIQIYSVIMFFSGVALTHAVFFLDRQRKEKQFFTYISASILQILDCVHSVHMASIEFAKEQLKNLEEEEREEYLKKESQNVSLFMQLYVLVFIRAVPKSGRKYINYKDWTEAQALIEKLRGFTSERDKG